MANTIIIDGKAIAAERAASLKLKVQEFKSLTGRGPKLVIVLVGDDLPAGRQVPSKVYVNLKVKKAKELGIETKIVNEVSVAVTDWADGVIVQLPGPQELIDQIPLEKDVDGLREGVALPAGRQAFLPATVKAILTIKDSIASPQNDAVWVIVGQGRLVGKPLAKFLKSKSLKVIECDINTKNLKEETLKGDVLVSATGVDGLITADMVKPGAIVIDCGSPKAEVDFENVKNIAGAITPVPGGVGPLTVICLLENLVEAVKIRHNERY